MKKKPTKKHPAWDKLVAKREEAKRNLDKIEDLRAAIMHYYDQTTPEWESLYKKYTSITEIMDLIEDCYNV